ncbi:MAG: protein kinase, partial [Pseudomonadota bacterium]
ERSTGFLATARSAAATEALNPLQPGESIGSWTVKRPLGAGGQGQVYECEREVAGARQRGALKRLGGAATAAATRRMLRERQTLAALQHPAIPALLDGGIAAGGEPYLVVEMVDGQTLDRAVAERPRDQAWRLDVLLALCDALAHAHGRLVVHRDLKPGNVLVDDSGRVHLLDFGIARALDDEGDTATRPLFTIGFAAPEQVSGQPPTAALDVHGLGAVAYWLFAGRAPFRQNDAAATLRSVLEDEPGPIDGIPAELDAIVRRALRKRPEDRYASIGALRADLEAFRDGRPVAAMRGGSLYRARKFVRRHALAVISTVVLAATIATAMTASLRSAEKAREAEAVAREEASRYRAIADIWTQVFSAASPDVVGQEVVTARDLMVQARDRILELEEQPEAQAELLLQIANTHVNRGEFEEALAVARALIEIVETSPPRDADIHTQAYLMLGTALKMSGALPESVAPLEVAVDRLRQFPSPEPIAMPYTLNMLATSLAASGALEDALTLQDEIGDVVAGGGAEGVPPWLISMHRANRAELLFKLERREEAELALRANLEAATASGDPVSRSATARFLGRLALEDGRPDDAIGFFDTAVEAVVDSYSLDDPRVRMDWLRARHAETRAGRRSPEALFDDVATTLPLVDANTQFTAEARFLAADAVCARALPGCGELLDVAWQALADPRSGTVAGAIALARAEDALRDGRADDASIWARRAGDFFADSLPAMHTRWLLAQAALAAAERDTSAAARAAALAPLIERWGEGHSQVRRAEAFWP